MVFGEKFVTEKAEELQHFLFSARTSASWGSNPPVTFDGGRKGVRVKHTSGWQYTDSWYGGEPYSGITTVAYQGEVCWSMVYWGRVLPGMDCELVYQCLRPALASVQIEAPWRGPREFEAPNGLKYRNSWLGDIKRFEGTEDIIDFTGHIFYTMKYMGGFVNLEDDIGPEID